MERSKILYKTLCYTVFSGYNSLQYFLFHLNIIQAYYKFLVPIWKFGNRLSFKKNRKIIPRQTLAHSRIELVNIGVLIEKLIIGQIFRAQTWNKNGRQSTILNLISKSFELHQWHLTPNTHTKFREDWPKGLWEKVSRKNVDGGRTDGRTDDDGSTPTHKLRWPAVTAELKTLFSKLLPRLSPLRFQRACTYGGGPS